MRPYGRRRARSPSCPGITVREPTWWSSAATSSAVSSSCRSSAEAGGTLVVTAGAEATLAAPSPFQPEELQWILDRMPSGVVVVDPDLVVRYFNASAQRLFEPERLRIGSRMPDLRTEERLADVVARIFGDGAVTGHQLRRDGGDTYVVDGVTTERRARVILRLDDVTAQAQRMQAGHDFIVNAAHEFLSPLTAIAGAAHVLQDGAKDVPGVRDRFVSHIVEGSNRLISLSRALLVLARAEAGV